MQLKLKAEFFYAEDEVVASINPGWLQTAFYMLTRLIDWVVLKKNQKIMGMVCHPCWAAGVRVDKSYTRRIAGVGGWGGLQGATAGGGELHGVREGLDEGVTG